MSVLMIVRAGFWLVTLSLAIAAMTAKKSLYTVSYSLEGVSISADVGMFTARGSVSGGIESPSESIDTTKFFDGLGIDEGYAKAIQAGAICGLLMSTLSFAVCALAYACATGCSGACLKTAALLLDVVAASFFILSWAGILVAYNEDLAVPAALNVELTLSDVCDLGPGVALLATCTLLTLVSGYLACCIAPRRTEGHEQLPASNGLNAAQQDYTSAH